MTGCCSAPLSPENQTKNVDHVNGYTAGSTVQPGFFSRNVVLGGKLLLCGEKM